jgi:hypothetical protein
MQAPRSIIQRIGTVIAALARKLLYHARRPANAVFAKSGEIQRGEFASLTAMLGRFGGNPATGCHFHRPVFILRSTA